MDNNNNNNNNNNSEIKSTSELDKHVFSIIEENINTVEDVLELCRDEKQGLILNEASTKEIRERWQDIERLLREGVSEWYEDYIESNDPDKYLNKYRYSLSPEFKIPDDIDFVDFCRKIYEVITCDFQTNGIIDSDGNNDERSMSTPKSLRKKYMKDNLVVARFHKGDIEFIRNEIFNTPQVPSYADAKVLFTFLYLEWLRPHESGWISYSDKELNAYLREYKKLPSSHENNLSKIIQRLFEKELVDFRVVGKENPITCFALPSFKRDATNTTTTNTTDTTTTNINDDDNDDYVYKCNGKVWLNPNRRWETFDKMFKDLVAIPILGSNPNKDKGKDKDNDKDKE